MKLIFEKSVAGRGMEYLPKCDVDSCALPASLQREAAPKLPEISETDLSRHYTELNKRVHGVNSGFYPLGSCTMKYNPRIDEEMAALPGFANIHPLAPAHTTLGCQEALETTKKYMCEIFGMDDCTFQPAAGAHGEFTGVLLIKQYHDARGEGQQRFDGPAHACTAGPWVMTFLRRLRKVSRSSMTIRPQPEHLILISAPVRVTVHSLAPQGWGLRVWITSPMRIS